MGLLIGSYFKTKVKFKKRNKNDKKMPLYFEKYTGINYKNSDVKFPLIYLDGFHNRFQFKHIIAFVHGGRIG